MKTSGADRVFGIVNGIFLLIIFLAVAYPLYFIIIASVSEPAQVAQGKMLLLPKGLSFAGYVEIVKNNELLIGYANSLFYTIFGTIWNLTITMMAAYGLSNKKLYGRKFLLFYFLFTMFFNGGLIPTYLTVKDLHLLNTYLILIVWLSVSVYNLIIARTFIEQSIPFELYEAASSEGCGHFRYFFSVVLPLSKAVIAVLTIFYAVLHWNEYFNALMYLTDVSKQPLQIFLRKILIQNSYTDALQSSMDNASEAIMVAESMKYGVIIVASIPVLILYPFVQKYFMKGVMIGAVKG